MENNFDAMDNIHDAKYHMSSPYYISVKSALSTNLFLSLYCCLASISVFYQGSMTACGKVIH